MENNYRKDFPFFKLHSNWIYFDNGATTQKPEVMFKAIEKYYLNASNHERGDYSFENYDLNLEINNAREEIAKFLSTNKKNIVFAGGSTASSNLIANSLYDFFENDDEIITTKLEHSSNILPWIRLAKIKKCKIKFVKLTPNYEVDIEYLKSIITAKTKAIILFHSSNTFGSINDIESIVKIAKEKQIITIFDCAQSAPHFKLNFNKYQPTFAYFSGHKLFGPTGIGVMFVSNYGYTIANSAMLGGGQPLDILAKDYKDENIFFKKFLDGKEKVQDFNNNISLKHEPYKMFEAGTLPIAQIIGLSATIEYLNKIGINVINQIETELKNYLILKMKNINEIEIYNINTKLPIIIFNVKNVNSHDVGSYFARNKVAIRSGNSCARLVPFMEGEIGQITSFIRISLSFLNTKKEIDHFIELLENGKDFMGGLF